MAFNPLEYLKAGKVDFVFNLTTYDFNSLIKIIREKEDREIIIDGFLPKLIDNYRHFCFPIIYDIDKYEKETKYLLSKNFQFDDEKLINVLNKTKWGVDYIYEHLDFYINRIKEETIIKIFDFIFSNQDKYENYILYFKLHSNLHFRYLFMKYIIENYPDLVNIIYDDFTKYLTSYTHQEFEQLTFLPELMESKDVCDLSFLILKSKIDKVYYYKLKEHILRNYPKNDLAEALLKSRQNFISQYSYTLYVDEDGIKAFKEDADNIFLSSKNYQLYIYRDFAEYVSQNIMEEFSTFIKKFRKEDMPFLNRIFYYELGDLLKIYIDKYMSLSVDNTYEYIKEGSTGCVYRFGDYVIKLFRTKWSYEDVICPNLYLILKNLEEHYVRNSLGIVNAGLEVQPFLHKDANNVPDNIWSKYLYELSKLGYRYTDTLIGGTCGDNCRILDSYKDADCNNPNVLPNWFKKYPVVLVDRDRVYDKEKIVIKQLNEGY